LTYDSTGQRKEKKQGWHPVVRPAEENWVKTRKRVRILLRGEAASIHVGVINTKGTLSGERSKKPASRLRCPEHKRHENQQEVFSN